MPASAGGYWTRWSAVRQVILAILVVAAPAASAIGRAHATDDEGARWKGAETLHPIVLAPAPLRCGPSPRFVEGRFAGTGMDSVGGTFVVTASGCLDTEALRLFDLEATDIYTTSGASLTIEPDDVDLDLDRTTCVAVNRHPVPFTASEGTGVLAGATGHGTFDLALSYPPCGGLPLPVHVWFRGVLQLPR